MNTRANYRTFFSSGIAIKNFHKGKGEALVQGDKTVKNTIPSVEDFAEAFPWMKDLRNEVVNDARKKAKHLRKEQLSQGVLRRMMYMFGRMSKEQVGSVSRFRFKNIA